MQNNITTINVWEEPTINSTSFRRNRSAVTGLPLYLLVMIITLAIALVLLTHATFTMHTTQDTTLFSIQLQTLIDNATRLYACAHTNTTATYDFTIPSTIQLVVFGGLPTNTTDNAHTTNTRMDYYYLTVDGSVVPGHAHVRFCGTNETQPACFHTGHNHLTLHLLITPTGPYVALTT